MNLEEVVDPEYRLQQDEWSLSKPRFGKDCQLEVIGWSGRNKSGTKIYVLKCDYCINDPELFGEGIFKSQKNRLLDKSLPCGCSGRHTFTEDQYKIVISRFLVGSNHTLNSMGEFNGIKTTLNLTCKLHGNWDSSSINGLLSGCTTCKSCKFESIKFANRLPDDLHISTFMSTGCFANNTKFTRVDRRDSAGGMPYWEVFCPDCGERGEAITGDLKRGMRPCMCSPSRQKQAYINLIRDTVSGDVVAVKFGIANNSDRRLYTQSIGSVFKIDRHCVYSFKDKNSCLQAERECKQTLHCGVVHKNEMPDGYTETTHLCNLEKILEIYIKYGGVEVVK